MDSLLSDFDSYSESSSSDDQEDIESLYSGRAHTIFSSLEQTIEKIDDFLIFERSFSHGDIVRLVSDPLGQMGKIVNVEMKVDLENLYGSIKTENVNSKSIRKIRSVSVGDHVVHGPWLGRVEKVIDRLTVIFDDDGQTCELSAKGPEKIITATYSPDDDLLEDPNLPFYPGQRVRVESPGMSTRWCGGIRKDEKNKHGTVCSVDAGLVHVDWLVSCMGPKVGPGPPQGPMDSRDLSVVPCFLPHANWQLGDWCVHDDRLKKGRGPHGEEEEPSFSQVAVVVKTRTRIDVRWQDGSESCLLDLDLVFPVNVLDAHDFWPDSFVREEGMTDDVYRASGFEKWGVVKSVDSKERMVKVKWVELESSSLDSEQEEEEMIVSAYELVEHSDYTFGLGEVVFRIIDKKNMENSESLTEGIIGNKFLTCFGTVVGFENGCVEVKWGTGAISKVFPYEIFRVEKGETELNNENVEPPNEELSLKAQFAGQGLKDLDDNPENAGSNTISRAAIEIFNSITSSLLGSIGMLSLIGGYKYASQSENSNKTNPDDEEEEEEDNLDMHEKTISLHIKEANEDFMFLSSSRHHEPFKKFDMVNDPSNHHFVNENGSPQVKKEWLRKVHQEWSILEKDLPETIYVRVYEERMDLLRAAIVGTDGTPYHDGLFFFDIYLPPQYPNEPPIVHYNSGGLRINPNLYESGKICLSLLNTWKGSQSEAWNPNSSTILQILLSIQALVLNEKPYFNEAGYDSQVGKVEGEKNSVSYNENAFLVSCRSMLYLLRNPPKHFEALVHEHFSQRSKSILLACKAYMEGASIGYYTLDYEKTEQEIQKGSSTGFKIMLAKLYSKLVEALSDKGFQCNSFSGQVP
ncbi:ubiquitin-conjugating enzyme family protein [Striga asiatica]|uniref:E2 ubiquitin-conjugating enzyme n=1 Tax=Striga asiatica TaxID=4170 RepID=A0A5A7PFU6_STRAF|nr:ubiquitin-conjugating enzyme family protein [Striga asiatica]